MVVMGQAFCLDCCTGLAPLGPKVVSHPQALPHWTLRNFPQVFVFVRENLRMKLTEEVTPFHSDHYWQILLSLHVLPSFVEKNLLIFFVLFLLPSSSSPLPPPLFLLPSSLLQPSNPVHSEVSTTLRQTVVYSCIQHLWRTFPIYSEQLLPSLPIDVFYDEEIVATTLALASRLFSIQRKESKKRLKSMMETI